MSMENVSNQIEEVVEQGQQLYRLELLRSRLMRLYQPV